MLKFWMALFCALIIWMHGLELRWTGSLAGQSIFHAYTKPMPIPEFSLENLQGQTINIRDYRGQAILLNFWATW
ncbi:MAG: redoxin domain-containing protein [Deltaproteobacteria bacterium]|nr:redoxin domain-containing protein [Deltaproteobacteria bacterium]